MKTNWKITAALVALGMGIVSQASAATTPVVYLTGSTAFRSTVYTALNTPGTVFDSGQPIDVAEFGSSQSGANYMLFGGYIDGTYTYIDCAWSGSEAGIGSAADVTVYNTDRDGNTIALSGSPEVWLKADGSIPMNGTQPEAAAPTTAQLENNGVASHGADLAQADTSQAVSFTPPDPSQPNTELVDFGSEAAVTFVWAKNVNSNPSASWNNLKNVNLEELSDFIARGSEPVAAFTGIASDTNQYVYLVGRNKGSGTRANALSCTAYGTHRDVYQYSIGEGIEVAATGTLVLDYEANNGYESGGGVATALGIDGSCQQTDPVLHNGVHHTGWMAIGYLGISDALAHGLTTANWLTLDGVPYSDGAVEEGQYSFWGHEHLYGKNGITGIQQTVGQKLFNGVVTALGTAGSNPAAHDPGILYQYMHCTKSSDTAFPIHNP